MRRQRQSGAVRARDGAHLRRLRIIGGKWRGRRWQFPAGAIRPTGDRVRETLFNWLQRRIEGRRCLDLYAGSGALGLEALSRGAAHCVFVDQDAGAVAALAALLREWGAGSDTVQLEHCSAEKFLARAAQRFDLVFLDPPFATAAIAAIAVRLEAGGHLAPGCLIYLEHPRAQPLPPLPAAWRAVRSGAAGAVGYDLYRADATNAHDV
jgi:16S rRNA (guanine966-N2)-methyltransferase